MPVINANALKGQIGGFGVGKVGDGTVNPPLFVSNIASFDTFQFQDMGVFQGGSYFSGGKADTYTIVGLPNGLIFNEFTGAIYGQPTVAGVFTNIVITAYNISGQASSNSFSIDVGNACYPSDISYPSNDSYPCEG